VTQQTTWNSSLDPQARERHWMLYRNGKHYQEALMDEALESLNDVMRDVAQDHFVYLYDLARAMPKTREYFYDDVHFNVKGASVMALGLGHSIAPLLAETVAKQ
jgi:lysophospholipase L1-like esterase